MCAKVKYPCTESPHGRCEFRATVMPGLGIRYFCRWCLRKVYA